ncbi:unnamed protein product [Acanthoscelides obtectus]|uniref:RRM domain-containing protein n=1 Tax=Acanthoscelides obtectus TaxID=200917 RepID=A0A9P0K4X0_ACAOB|nr:unnamed protein product [Acanthoscelides obtectus]CAK1648644.1 Polymerase delta-interacting protein 3 [Acanthoscelides obtectus]
MAKQKASNKYSRLRSQKLQNQRNKNQKSKNGVEKRVVRKKVQDARQKIILKKKNVVDARDIISKKSVDARAKINKIRTGRPEGPTVKVIGSGILQKIDSNGKISLVTNKAKQKNEVKNDINLAIRKELGLIPTSRRTSAKRSPARNTVPIRKTGSPEYRGTSESRRLFDPALYKWVRPDLRSKPQLVDLQTTRQVMRETLREELSCGWPTYASHINRSLRLTGPVVHTAPAVHRSVAPRHYIDLEEPAHIVIDDEEMPMVTSSAVSVVPSRSSNVRSRLDGAPAMSAGDSHGIFSGSGGVQKKVVIVPEGHRIVVSNLQNTVTQDDIKELFEDIGQLISAKLVRPGVAEVIYKNLKDAQKAVDTYHNRQLDGQPMKCLLVNKRPLNHPTALPVNTQLFTKKRLGLH